MSSTLHERLHFDAANGAVLDTTRRYVLLRTDVLMGLFDELPDPARSEALRAFGRSVARHRTPPWGRSGHQRPPDPACIHDPASGQ